jgi:hypothetical protein
MKSRRNETKQVRSLLRGVSRTPREKRDEIQRVRKLISMVSRKIA